MNRASIIKHPPRLRCRWLSSLALKFASFVLACTTTLCAAQPVLLQEPDFAGMFTINDTGPAPLLRDTARGWTYFAAGNAEGVAFTRLFRINDSGLPDTQWRLPADFQTTEQYLAEDGTVIARAYVKNSTTSEQRWYRLQASISGEITPVEISNVADLPPRDHIDLQQNTGLEPRLLPQRDGVIIAFEVAVTPTTATYTLRKRDRNGREQWSLAVGGRTHNMASDAQGNVYLLGETLTVGSKRSDLLRIRADGSVDTAWNPDIGILTYVSAHLRVVQDRIIVASTFSGSPPVNQLTTFDLINGRKLVVRNPQYSVSGIADDGTALSAHANGHWALLDTTRKDASGDRVSVARVGGNGYMQTAVPWHGGYVIGGNFQYWFDGRHYRNLMRVDASLRPDPTWMPGIDDAVAALTTDRDGGLLVGSNAASGAQGRIQRFNASGALDTRWQATVKGDVYKLLATSDGMLFVGGAFSAVNNVPRNSLARFRADGTLDPDWASQPAWPVMQAVRWGQFGRDGIHTMLDAGDDGVFFTWEDGHMNGSTGGVIRISRAASGAVLPLPAAVASGGNLLRDPKSGDVFAIADAWTLSNGTNRGGALVRMVSPGMTIAPTWPATLTGTRGLEPHGFAYQSDSHVYACLGNLLPRVYRVDKLTGAVDQGWISDEAYLCGASLAERRSDGVTLVFSDPTGQLLQYSSTASNTPSAVVEYYSRDAKRFFITGRTNEIAQLDAMPTHFVRTGMTFAAETALVRTSDSLRPPICRFYAPADAGGSNTHFYGRGDDCTLLKRFSTLRYEGYDFRAGVPTNGVCQTTALPIPVFRLFNNASASNNGNHRYVPGDLYRNEMRAAGWVDEGVAFCTSVATDPRPLADIVR